MRSKRRRVPEDRKLWPKEIVEWFHVFHLAHDTKHAQCPYCTGEWQEVARKRGKKGTS